MDWSFLRLRGVLDEVGTERKRQFKQYGSNPFNERVDKMIFVLGEEIGEVNAAMVEYLLAETRAIGLVGPGLPINRIELKAATVCNQKMAHVREELIQVAAVAVAITELIDFHGKFMDWIDWEGRENADT